MTKRGQAYLIATVIIIVIISGFMFLSNYYSKEGSTFAYDLKKQLETEGEKVLDYGLVNGLDIGDVAEDFAEDFSEHAGESVEIYYIMEEEENADVYYFEGGKQSVPHTENGEVVNFTVGEVDYECKIREGNNLYFVVIQDTGSERYVAKSEDCLG
jgi:hypothetical protein